MKLLILTASAGMGHNRAAMAVEEYFKNKHPEVITRQYDTTKHAGFGTRWFYFKSYDEIVKYCPWFWNFWYKLTENKITGAIFDFFSSYNKKINCPKLITEINDFAPDYILCTHFTPPDLILNFTKIKIPVATIVTDYKPCRLWAFSSNQKYFVGHQDSKKDLIKNGINSEKIIVSGIPIGEKFLNFTNIPKDVNGEKNILIMPLPIGKIKIEKLVAEIIKNFPEYKINIICGKNVVQKRKLDKNFSTNNQNIKIMGLINNPEFYMHSADLIISKAGGITITEVLILKKPLIIINPIPGQETENTKFLIKNNFGAEAKNCSKAIELIHALLDGKINFEKLKIEENPMEVIWKNFLN